MIDHEHMWRVLTRFAHTLVRTYELDDVLSRLGDDVTGALGVKGAGVMLGDEDDNLRFTSTSDEVLKELEELQIVLAEGPCLLAYRSGQRVSCPDLEAGDDRFPRFAKEAVKAGMGSVHSFPMRIEEATFGAFNLYDTAPGSLDEEQAEAARVFSDIATMYLANARDLAQKDLLTAQLQHALTSRVLIEQAKGYVMARRGWDAETAFEAIRSFSRNRQLKVRAIARGILHGDIGVDRLERR